MFQFLGILLRAGVLHLWGVYARSFHLFLHAVRWDLVIFIGTGALGDRKSLGASPQRSVGIPPDLHPGHRQCGHAH